MKEYGFEEDSNLFEHSEENTRIKRWTLLKSTLIGGTIGMVSLVLVVVLVVVSIALSAAFQSSQNIPCGTQCEYKLVETIPREIHLVTPPNVLNTYDVYLRLIMEAKSSIKIGSFYWSFANNASEAGGDWGNKILKSLYEAKNRSKDISIEIIQTNPNANFPQTETEYLKQQGFKVVSIDPSKSLGGGVQHAKFLIVDNLHFYIGSANMDWRSLSEVKELGIMIRNCPCLANDLTKAFDIISYFGNELNNTLPSGFPTRFDTTINDVTPIDVTFVNSNSSKAYFAVSPQKVKSPQRTWELTAILNSIHNATKRVSIAIFDYYPMLIYGTKYEYWGEIDVVLRDAMLRNVEVNLLISKWNYTSNALWPGLKSLLDFNICQVTRRCSGKINIKIIEFPDPSYIPYPFTRVNHCKYLVTDTSTFISTSNWSKDYFYFTFGAGLYSDDVGITRGLQELFDRDWNSVYSTNL
jgi:phospholipase D3/4